MRGVDVSKWQGSIDWYQAFSHGVEFALCKATQGLGEVDDMIANNMHALRHYGYRRGWYHFPDASNAPAVEADKFLSIVGGQRGEVLMLDCEDDTGLPTNTHLFGLADPVAWVAAWCSHVLAKTGIAPLVYLSASRTTEYDWRPVVALDCGLDVADWDGAVDGIGAWPFYAIRQDGDQGHYPGIGTGCDTDVFNGGPAQWDAYAHGAPGSAPTPVPPPKVPNPAPRPNAYTVVSGDTLSGIADRFGTTVGQLVAWNFHRYPTLQANPGLIWPGWVLVVGLGVSGPVTHTVVSGDTLFGIAEAWGVGLGDVERANPQLGPPGRSFDVIRPGDVVRHP